MKRLDRRESSPGAGEILGFIRLRNEALRLPWCLEFHRRLGVDRFFVVDNDSTDGSREYLLSCPDVHVFWTRDSYAENRSGMSWVNRLLSEYAPGHWVVVVDVDELLIYPGYEHVGLRALARFLEQTGADGLECVMIDMYASTAIRDTSYEPGEDFVACCPYFDADALVDMRGGARKRLFWGEREQASKPPYLRKVPLIKWRSELAYEVSTHLIDHVTLSPVAGALLHFKLFSDFHEKVAVGVAERQYWESSAQYASYLEGLDGNPAMTAFHEGSVRFENSRQLVEMGVMRTCPEYDEFRAAETPLPTASEGGESRDGGG